MNATKAGLLIVLVLGNLAFVAGWIWAVRRHRLRDRPTVGDVAIGFVTDFFDTLGIGSYAPTTALYKFRGRPADELIPGTLNVGHNAAAFLETLLFVTAVTVQPLLLACMIASATARGVAGGRGGEPVAAPHDPAVHGCGAAHRGILFRAQKPRRVSARRRRHGPCRLALWGCRRGQLFPRRPDVHWHRQLRPEHDPAGAAWHASDCRLPDHDGQRWHPAAGGEPGVLQVRTLRQRARHSAS